jgi:lipoyl(octanoyl) transferase
VHPEGTWLGRVAFEEALDRQAQLAEAVASGHPERLLLLEHDPVYTIGRTRDRSSLREPSRLPHPIFEISRGGQATFHGPGQLVGYPILNLAHRGRDLHRYMRFLEDVLIGTASTFGVQATRREGLTGIWAGERKLASIGVGLRKWVSMHGFALNVCNSMEPFAEIIPCGIAGVTMTSLSIEAGRTVPVSLAADAIRERFGPALERTLPWLPDLEVRD